MRRSLRSKLLIPLDLHVLGLPLAFILSQDQTLHRILFIFAPRKRDKFDGGKREFIEILVKQSDLEINSKIISKKACLVKNNDYFCTRFE